MLRLNWRRPQRGYRSRKLLVLATVIGAGLCFGVNGYATTWAFFSTDQSGNYAACTVEAGAGTATVYVFLNTSVEGVSEFTLIAPTPECYTGSIKDTIVQPFIGDSQAGARVFLSYCQPSSAPLLIMTREVTVDASAAPCCEMWVTISDVKECGGGTDDGGSSNLILATDELCTRARIYDINPPDGATNVSLQPVLGFNYERAPECPPQPTALTETIYFGSSPNELVPFWGQVSIEPGPLEPQSTYYWSIHLGGEGGNSTPVMSFKTVDVPTTASEITWSLVKRLYR